LHPPPRRTMNYGAQNATLCSCWICLPPPTFDLIENAIQNNFDGSFRTRFDSSNLLPRIKSFLPIQLSFFRGTRLLADQAWIKWAHTTRKCLLWKTMTTECLEKTFKLIQKQR
jgi:hypothetical protein